MPEVKKIFRNSCGIDWVQYGKMRFGPCDGQRICHNVRKIPRLRGAVKGIGQSRKKPEDAFPLGVAGKSDWKRDRRGTLSFFHEYCFFLFFPLFFFCDRSLFPSPRATKASRLVAQKEQEIKTLAGNLPQMER